MLCCSVFLVVQKNSHRAAAACVCNVVADNHDNTMLSAEIYNRQTHMGSMIVKNQQDWVLFCRAYFNQSLKLHRGQKNSDLTFLKNIYHLLKISEDTFFFR